MQNPGSRNSSRLAHTVHGGDLEGERLVALARAVVPGELPGVGVAGAVVDL